MKAILQKFIQMVCKVFSLVFGHKIRSETNSEINISIQKGDVDIDIKSNSILDNEGTREIQ